MASNHDKENIEVDMRRSSRARVNKMASNILSAHGAGPNRSHAQESQESSTLKFKENSKYGSYDTNGKSVNKQQ